MMIEIEALATKAQRESSWVTPDNIDVARAEGQGWRRRRAGRSRRRWRH
jgi:hypothetical protein